MCIKEDNPGPNYFKGDKLVKLDYLCYDLTHNSSSCRFCWLAEIRIQMSMNLFQVCYMI